MEVNGTQFILKNKGGAACSFLLFSSLHFTSLLFPFTLCKQSAQPMLRRPKIDASSGGWQQAPPGRKGLLLLDGCHETEDRVQTFTRCLCDSPSRCLLITRRPQTQPLFSLSIRWLRCTLVFRRSSMTHSAACFHQPYFTTLMTMQTCKACQ